jgi:hypothetical protein
LVTTAGLFAAVVLLDILPALPGWLHFLLLAGFVAALGATSALLIRRLAMPRPAEARHRLERDSGLEHRPLSSLDDQLATPTGDPESAALWQAHRLRLKAQLAQLRVKLPRPGVAAADPLALRAFVVLSLVVGLAAGHGDWTRRLTAALTPQFGAVAAATPASLDLWINPPRHGGRAPFHQRPAPPHGGDRQGHPAFGLHDRDRDDRRVHQRRHGRDPARTNADAGSRHAYPLRACRSGGDDFSLAQPLRGQRH